MGAPRAGIGAGMGAGIVVRGDSVARAGDAVRRLLGAPNGHAVVLVRLSPPTPVSAAVVDVVVDVLVEAGCTVAVGTMLAGRERDRGHRSVGALAHAAGLTGHTGRGRPYAVVDLADDLVPARLPPTSVLAEHVVSRAWLDADTRVVIGRAVTDLTDTYAGCLDTLLRVVPEVPGCEPADVAGDLLRHVPPQLAVVDAVKSSVGADGNRILEPRDTDTVVVTTDPLLADVTLAALLGVDRATSRLVARVVAARGETMLGDLRGDLQGDVEGDLRPFDDIDRPHPVTTRAAQRLARDPRLARVVSAATGGPDAGTVPADPVLAGIRPLLTEAVRAASDPVGQAGLVGLLGVAGALTDGGHAWAATMDKAKIDRRIVPLGFDPAEHPDEDYDDLPRLLAAVDAAVDALPRPDHPDGLRWCLVDRATVFEMSRVVGADFDAWVERVDVAAGISLMADYVGGRRVVVGEDESGRLRQAERNLYLPQPNYVAAWGGEPIDVCKIELVERGPDRHRLLWRTVRSPNRSAVHDDGTLTFARTDTAATAGGTLVTIRGRQLFALPPVLEAADLPSLPELHVPLLEEAYRRFFTSTFDNLEACFEGREFRIGRPPPEPDEPLLTESVRLVLDALVSRFGADRERPAARAARGGADSDPEPGLDAHGFRHVRGPR
ncbi:hypothetical protein [Terrabacter sp. MAHUQ-38]|uniref:hypothetical protein n=1 Tax=unclassified Terrabacter TaxID=2630222 RepID=UPI00165E4CD6|nr:hypothetical protein [Terrabacter sp. MAHUQ-38]MBC9820561.1 hypothetical protein [Terrabacter sp. MAHUQ-38]